MSSGPVFRTAEGESHIKTRTLPGLIGFGALIAALISRLTSKKTVDTYIPGSTTYSPAYYGRWRDYYGYGVQAVSTPGYMAEDEYALMETNLYDAANDKLIWSTLSETEIENFDRYQIRSYITVIVNAMTEMKLLKR